MKFHIFLTPMHLVEVEAEQHMQSCGVHQFITGDQVIAEFANMIGWMEVRVDPKKEKASVSPISLVSSNNGAPAPPSEPAA